MAIVSAVIAVLAIIAPVVQEWAGRSEKVRREAVADERAKRLEKTISLLPTALENQGRTLRETGKRPL